MLRRTVLTFTTRFGTALLSFGVVLLTARGLGAAGRGRVSLMVTDVALLLLFIGLLGGSSLIYLAPRRNVWRLLVPAITWAVVVCALGAAVVAMLRPASPYGYAWHVGGVALVQALFSISASLLLGRRREGLFNILNLMQAALLTASLAVAFFGFGFQQIEAFYLANYLASGTVLVVAASALARQPDPRLLTRRALRRVAYELARHSRGAHLSSILVFLTYRLSYYFLAAWTGPGAVGVLSVGVALTEAFWLLGRSAAQTQYLDLVNASDRTARLPYLLRAARLTGFLTGTGLAILLAVPASVLAFVFGADFGAARPVIVWLAPGVFAMSIGMLLSTWFAGIGQYAPNNRATAAGLLVAAVACILLIPRFGVQGAAAATSLAYLTVASVLLWQFRRATGYGVRALLPRLTDHHPIG
ncbi:MAG: lipopolysaccharide biosynthesis protein [Hymenobacteraceae bacterium]|nr:lipopolysaccharide biosynthesis protein [Hymenobacteraceae bacterium]